MKSLIISLFLLLATTLPANAQGVFDDTVATLSASPSATPRAVAYLDTSDTPTSGAVENTIALFLGGIALIYIGIRYSRT